MEGPTPERASSEEYATLEDVFTSHTFGHSLSEATVAVAPARATLGERAKILPHSRVAASVAAAAAALSVVAGVAVGSSPIAPSLIAAGPRTASARTKLLDTADLGCSGAVRRVLDGGWR